MSIIISLYCKLVLFCPRRSCIHKSESCPHTRQGTMTEKHLLGGIKQCLKFHLLAPQRLSEWSPLRRFALTQTSCQPCFLHMAVTTAALLSGNLFAIPQDLCTPLHEKCCPGNDPVLQIITSDTHLSSTAKTSILVRRWSLCTSWLLATTATVKCVKSYVMDYFTTPNKLLLYYIIVWQSCCKPNICPYKSTTYVQGCASFTNVSKATISVHNCPEIPNYIRKCYALHCLSCIFVQWLIPTTLVIVTVWYWELININLLTVRL